MPIRELLNRIHWDTDFARGNFELGYFDRAEGRIIVVPFRDLVFSPDDSNAFRIIGAEGIPL